MLAPDLILYETANALRYNPRFTKEDVRRALASILDMRMEILVPTSNILGHAAEFAFKHNITLYDSYYRQEHKFWNFLF